MTGQRLVFSFVKTRFVAPRFIQRKCVLPLKVKPA